MKTQKTIETQRIALSTVEAEIPGRRPGPRSSAPRHIVVHGSDYVNVGSEGPVAFVAAVASAYVGRQRSGVDASRCGAVVYGADEGEAAGTGRNLKFPLTSR